MKKLLLALLLGATALTQNALPQVPTQEQLQTADAQLNQVYQQLHGTLNDAQKQQLKQAQRDWIKKRDAFVAANPGNPQGALYQATMQRVVQLRGYMGVKAPVQHNQIPNQVKVVDYNIEINELNNEMKEVYERLYNLLEEKGKQRLIISHNKWQERKKGAMEVVGIRNDLLIQPIKTRIKLYKNNIEALKNGWVPPGGSVIRIKSQDIFEEGSNVAEDEKVLADNNLNYILSKIKRFAGDDITSKVISHTDNFKIKINTLIEDYRKDNLKNFLNNKTVGILEGGYIDINSSYVDDVQREITKLEAILKIILENQKTDEQKSKRIEAVFQAKSWNEKNYISECLGKRYRILSIPGSNKIYIFDVRTKLMYGTVENSAGLEVESKPPSFVALCDNENIIYSKKTANRGGTYQFNYIPDLSLVMNDYIYRSDVDGPYKDEKGQIGVKIIPIDEPNNGNSLYKSVDPEKVATPEQAIENILGNDVVKSAFLNYENIPFSRYHEDIQKRVGANFYSPKDHLFPTITASRMVENNNLLFCADGVASTNSELSIPIESINSSLDEPNVMSASLSDNNLDLQIMIKKPAGITHTAQGNNKIENLIEFKSFHIDLQNLTFNAKASDSGNIYFNPMTIENPRPAYMPNALERSVDIRLLKNYQISFDGLQAKITDEQEGKSSVIPELFQMVYLYNNAEHISVGYSIAPEKYRSNYSIRIHNFSKNKDIYYSNNNRSQRSFSQVPSHFYDPRNSELWLSDSSSIFSIDTASGAILKSIDIGKKFEVFALSQDKIFGMPRMDESLGEIWSRNPVRKICDVLWDNEGNVMLIGKDGFYARSGKSIKQFAARLNGRVYPFEQFDLYLNRPDIVFSNLGADPGKITFLKESHQRRLKRMGVTEEMLKPDFHLPELQIVGDVPATSTQDQLDLLIKGTDDKYPLDRLRVYVNNVPVNGRDGELLRDQKTQSLEKTIPIKLAAGRNKIQVSVLNSAGAESLYANAEVNCTADRPKPMLYAVALGVSQYDRPEWCLKYAAKDATDLINKIKEKAGSSYSEVKPLLLTDKDVTKESTGKIKEFLSGATIDDTVLIFMAGHGLLDDKYDYYFGTSDIDPSKPSERGMPYEAIDNILAEVPSLKKSLLMDTCHAGELDDDEKKDLAASDGSATPAAIPVADTNSSPLAGKVAMRSIGTRGMSVKAVEGAKGKSDWYEKLQDMFVDLRRGSGATVISSSQGAEYAFESSEQSNGLFTYALMEALDGKATPNKDGQITISSIGDYVKKRVQDLTKGKQNPNLRGVNLEEDFDLVGNMPTVNALVENNQISIPQNAIAATANPSGDAMQGVILKYHQAIQDRDEATVRSLLPDQVEYFKSGRVPMSEVLADIKGDWKRYSSTTYQVSDFQKPDNSTCSYVLDYSLVQGTKIRKGKLLMKATISIPDQKISSLKASVVSAH